MRPRLSTRCLQGYEKGPNVAGPAVTPGMARRCFQTSEPIHGMIYFTPYRAECYAAAGITHQRTAYFASRAAAMGAVPAETVIAAFFNFNPDLVRRAIPAAWEIASPAEVLAARLDVADRSLRKAWGEDADGAAVREAAELARRAAEQAAGRPEGRPLFAGHAALPWPKDPHLVLWHAQTLLREYRGDGHVALLLTAGLDGIGALITHAATGTITAEALRTTRAWSEEHWAAGVVRARAQGWLDDGPVLALSEAGQGRRQSIEQHTDELAVYPYEAIGADGCSRLAELARPLSAAIMAADLGFPAALGAR
jgi:Helix-turn-helix family